MPKVLTREDVIEMLRAAVKLHGNSARAAEKLGLTAPYLWQLLNDERGQKDIGRRVLDALGLDIRYVRKGDSDKNS